MSSGFLFLLRSVPVCLMLAPQESCSDPYDAGRLLRVDVSAQLRFAAASLSSLLQKLRSVPLRPMHVSGLLAGFWRWM